MRQGLRLEEPPDASSRGYLGMARDVGIGDSGFDSDSRSGTRCNYFHVPGQLGKEDHSPKPKNHFAGGSIIKHFI